MSTHDGLGYLRHMYVENHQNGGDNDYIDSRGNIWAQCIAMGVLKELYTSFLRTYRSHFSSYPTYEDFLEFAADSHAIPHEVYHVCTNFISSVNGKEFYRSEPVIVDTILSEDYYNAVEQKNNTIYSMFLYLLNRRESQDDNVCYLLGSMTLGKVKNFVHKFMPKIKYIKAEIYDSFSDEE